MTWTSLKTQRCLIYFFFAIVKFVRPERDFRKKWFCRRDEPPHSGKHLRPLGLSIGNGLISIFEARKKKSLGSRDCDDADIWTSAPKSAISSFSLSDANLLLPLHDHFHGNDTNVQLSGSGATRKMLRSVWDDEAITEKHRLMCPICLYNKIYPRR